HVAIHIPEFNGAPDGILPWPLFSRERCADDRNVWSIGAVALVEDAPLEEWNPKHLKISISYNAKIRFSEPLFLTQEKVKVARHFLQGLGLGDLVLRHHHKLAIGNAPAHGKAAGGAHLVHTR